MPPDIIVIDGVMGAGKTTHIINEINKGVMQRYIYVTPFLDEVERIKLACPMHDFKEPKSLDGRKLKGLKELVDSNANIATTHALLSLMDNELITLLHSKDYTLVIDETLESSSIEYVSPIARQLIAQTQCVSICPETAKATWDSFAFPSTEGNEEFDRIRKQCDCEALYWLPRNREKGDGFIAWHFPAKAFACFSKVYILTYQFEGSPMDAYMRLQALEYRIDNRFSDLDTESRTRFKALINFMDSQSPWVTDLDDYALSRSWFMRDKEKRIKQVSATLKTLCNKHKVTSKEAMWTSFKEPAKEIATSKMVLSKPVPPEASEARKRRCNFVPCNSRATNRHGERSVLFYLANRFPNLELEQYFKSRGLPLDRDRFALNEMLQWIFRSRIRNGEPIKLFAPSPRMRGLLEDWLNGDDLKSESSLSHAA
ncbi:DEAD/DEAH box helicase family protein [Pseudodesulfovibrio portus]|uniref:Thymidine kinase n=1 Tax=Pseudodesulfovibrio portus TaxID=231439 RepID=A0ABN6RVT0_9BACT|nr:DEAD/DEAH box helicase family protein [Pseudodesulfovibrio portus]BDQ34814.1 hypothetical protein JCM14722_23560 [Pseudodesulfovibrio portus]